MREQELKLEKVKKSCNTTKKFVGVFKIIMIVLSVICILSAGTLFAFRNQVNEGISEIQMNDPDSFVVDQMEFDTGLFYYNIDTDLLAESGQYAEAFAIMCILGAVVLIFVVIVFALIQKIFITIEKEETPFSEKVLRTIKKLFIGIAVIMGLEIGLGTGLFMGLFFWCIYNIMDYGYALQKEIDETL